VLVPFSYVQPFGYQVVTSSPRAARLHCGENAVQTHVRHAYAKLGVSSRIRRLARLFQETCWPTLAVE